jgi:predicted DNA-binding ribbon-helix-helix protein
MAFSDGRAILRNVRVSGRRTSVKLEAAMWEALFELCARTGLGVDQVCQLAAEMPGDVSFSARLRVLILNFYRGRWRPPAEREQGAPPEASASAFVA